MTRHRLSLIVLSMMVAMSAVSVWLAHMPSRTMAAPSSEQRVCKTGGGNFSTIQSAIDVAQPGDVVKVAAGVYTETKTVGAFQYNLYINKSIQVLGGYTCSNWTARDPNANVTTIRPSTANISVVTIAGTYGQAALLTPVVDGFTISGGGGGNHGGGIRVNDSNATISHNLITGNKGYLYGGGIWVQRGAPHIENNTITNNRLLPGGAAYGGGIELEGAQATIQGNLISGNVISDSLSYGGGVAVLGGNGVVLDGNTITANAAASLPGPATDSGYGGGVAVQGAPVTMTNNIIQGNFANTYGDLNHYNAGGNGGGVYLSNSSRFILTGNTIDSNVTAFSYQATNAYTYGGGLLIDTSQGILTNNTITHNMANRYTIFGNGGGLAALNSTLKVQGGVIQGNSTSLNDEGYGGGLYLSNSKLTLDATSIDHNNAGNTPFYGKGGGLAFVNSPYTITNAIVSNNYNYNTDTGVGGLYASTNSPGQLANNTFADNKGQGIRIGSPLTMVNNIIMGATTGVSTTVSASVNATYNDFYNVTTPLRGVAFGTTNIIINPQLDASFHLTASSVLLDAGTRTGAPPRDFDGEPRPMIGSSGFYRVDIGADEFTGPGQTNRNLNTQPADFTLIGPGNPQDDPTSNGSNDWIGFAALGGDLSGDHRADLVVGAPNLSGNFDGGTNDDGRVFSLYNTGTRRLGVTDLYTTTASLEVRSWINQQHIGRSFAASDLNGDGVRDLIIGSIGGLNNTTPVTGTVYVFSGGPGLSGTRTLSPTMQANYRFISSESTQSFGEANSLAAGQLNGSGPDDLVVGETNGTGPGNRLNAGAVRVFFGSNSLPAVWNTRLLPASLTIYGPAANKLLGKVALADFNGDSHLDLIARSVDTVYVFYGPLSPGVIDLASASASLSIGGLGSGPLAAGDVNGDPYAEILAGDGNSVRIIAGNSTVTLATLTNVTPNSLHVFDWNGDGKGDVVVGEPTKNRAMVLFGRSTWIPSADITDEADWIITGQKSTDQFGYSLGSGDLDADGGQDLILGSRTHTLITRVDPHFNDAGAVYVLYGQPGALSMQKVFLPTLIR